MKSTFSLDETLRKRLAYLLGLSLLIRLVSVALLPLTDTTEARYGEIARKMVETGNWVTPLHDYGVPFWAKPPLSTWLSSISMELFGVNEFAARLPHFLLGLGVAGMVWFLGKRRQNSDFGFLSACILMSFPLFYVASGAVMTDMSLAFSVSISFVAFWLAITDSDDKQGRLFGYLFFVGQGIGLLAKGPICGVLTVFPIFFWMLGRGHLWPVVWRRLPWVKGILLMLIIAVPWYVMAELRTPGFLKYFIVGEHFSRFLIPGWKGDLYGHAHVEPIGTIWLFWLGATLPWSLLIVGWLLSRIAVLRELFRQDSDGWAWYLLIWAVWPMVFFTMAHNIIWPYVITGLPACALLMVEMWHRNRVLNQNRAPLFYKSWIAIPLLLSSVILAVVVSMDESNSARQTQKQIANTYLTQRESSDSQLYYLFRRYASAEFYTRGVAKHTQDVSVVNRLLENNTRDFIAINDGVIEKIPNRILNHFTRLQSDFGVVLFEENKPDLPKPVSSKEAQTNILGANP